MRRILILSLLASLCLASFAEARLFRQTFGATIPDESGCGCTWNWNQDYFVPRHPDSCRYGLFSACKTSCTTSPACKWCHPFYPGYCSIYGPCHYCWRNHVYKKHCGCTPLCVSKPTRACGCGKGCFRNTCSTIGCQTCGSCPTSCHTASGICEAWAQPAIVVEHPLPNVEPAGLEVLGSISVEGDGLLANVDLQNAEERALDNPLLQLQKLNLPEILPSLGLPKDKPLPQLLPSP